MRNNLKWIYPGRSKLTEIVWLTIFYLLLITGYFDYRTNPNRGSILIASSFIVIFLYGILLAKHIFKYGNAVMIRTKIMQNLLRNPRKNNKSEWVATLIVISVSSLIFALAIWILLKG